MNHSNLSLLRRAAGLALALGASLAFTVCSRADVVTQPLRKFGLGDVQRVAVSPNRQWMATSGSAGAFLWDFQTGTMLRRLEAHHTRVPSLCFSPDSQVLLTGGGDAVIRAWQVDSGTELRSFTGHVGQIFDLAFSPDGDSFVSQADSTVRVWSLSAGELLHTFVVPGTSFFQARFAPDGRRLVTAELSYTNMPDGSIGTLPDNVRVWDLATQQMIRKFGGTNFIQSFEFVAGGHLVAQRADLLVQLWDIETGELIRALPGATQAEFGIVGFSAATNSSTVSAGFVNGRVITWDASTGQIRHDFVGETIYAMAPIPGTSQILTANGSDNLVRVKDTQTGTTLRTFEGHTTSAIAGVGFSPDRRYVLSGGHEVFTRLWNRTNAQPVRTLAGYAGGTATARFSPDGTRILTTFGPPNYSARLLNAETGTLEREFFGHTGLLSAAVFSPDGQRMATGAYDGTARLWEVATGTQVRVFNSPSSLITAVAVSSNTMTLASGASDGIVRLWNTANGQLLHSLQPPFAAGSVSSVEFSPATGELLVAWADGVLQSFDPETGAAKQDAKFAGGFLHAAVFSPDGRFILDAEGWPSFSARLWDARTGEELRVFAEHAGDVGSIAFDPAGTCILTGADIVRLWSIADLAARLESERKPNGLELRWRLGTLQYSAQVTDAWTDVLNAVSPWPVPTDQASGFFRVKVAGE
jgi:WD40 repeat protein